MTSEAPIGGVVLSHTTIRVPGAAHAERAPFVLLLVEAEDGTRRLGHFAGDTPPQIGSRVVSAGAHDKTIVFQAIEEK
jgi:uncharacterized OB-fold protein